jgi:glycosyltransferase involved in cell wall biosynthesis
MRILYAALDQRVPGTTGGSVHVTAVAEGLAALGHEVDVLTTQGDGPFPAGGARWHAMAPPLGLRHLRFLRTSAVRAFAERARADVIIERYFNFGGEGIDAARATGAIGVLEVNAPIIDYPGSPKRWLDRALIVEPMRRWRDRQCRLADLIVTPTAAIVPALVPAGRVVEIEWGADTDRFTPDAAGSVPFTRRPGTTLAVFAGAFRAWHGATGLVRAIRALRDRGRQDIDAVLIGDGPELAAARGGAANVEGITFTGALPHAQVPACLAAADIGVAPFETAAHPPLQLAFYWSPLKVFEYMAAGLPVVAPLIPRLASIVGDRREGLLYDPEAPGALADALAHLADRPEDRRRYGAAARARAVREFSWAAHCRKLDEVIRRAVARRVT